MVLRSIDERRIVLNVFNLDDDAASVCCANAVELKLNINKIRIRRTRCTAREEERNVLECHIKDIRGSIELPPDLATKLWRKIRVAEIDGIIRLVETRRAKIARCNLCFKWSVAECHKAVRSDVETIGTEVNRFAVEHELLTRDQDLT